MSTKTIYQSTPEEWDAYVSEYAAFNKNSPFSLSVPLLVKADGARPFSTATGILDNGCGTGKVTSELIDRYAADLPAAARLLASDFSPAMVKFVQELKSEPPQASNPVWRRVEPLVQDAQNLDAIPDSSLSHVLSGMVLFAVSDADKALAEARRTLEPGGVLALTAGMVFPWIDIWTYAQPLRPGDLWELSPAEGWRSVEAVEALVTRAGFREVSVDVTTMPMKMAPPMLRGFLRNFIKSKNPAAVTVFAGFSEEEFEKALDLIVEGAVKDYGRGEEVVLDGKVAVVSALK
ncbi:S-adenosyl-L-methionine-dependent methyltransferase [Parachaetomium inaequale]|uniref:S-adenosyl-L-methionine-dependent methyltransferase n=1 Tax=Parachaetomium inaequale TaxID=2588326 RepID=A0AAN6P9W2_9PEZI|nr:S-adenosyl-L-methionine-dependent methyltransferase [Parachaetomium inaequale]